MANFAPIPKSTEETATAIVNATIAVHRALGPGLLESAYEHCLAYELQRMGRNVQRQRALPIVYNDVKLDAGYRIDLVIDGRVLIEVKSVDILAPIHDAQVLTYLKLSGIRLGFLINFNEILVKDGLKRLVM